MSFMKNSPVIAFFEGQIDPTEFGVVRNYLTSPRSPIGYVLHVKEPDMPALLGGAPPERASWQNAWQRESGPPSPRSAAHPGVRVGLTSGT